MSQYEEIISTLNNYPFSSAFWYSILRPYWYRHLEYFWFQIDMKSNDIILQILLRQHSLELQAKATLPLTCWCVWSLRFLHSPRWAFLFFFIALRCAEEAHIWNCAVLWWDFNSITTTRQDKRGTGCAFPLWEYTEILYAIIFMENGVSYEFLIVLNLNKTMIVNVGTPII